MASSIKIFQKDFGKKAAAGYVIHPGDIRFPLAPNVMAIPFREF